MRGSAEVEAEVEEQVLLPRPLMFHLVQYGRLVRILLSLLLPSRPPGEDLDNTLKVHHLHFKENANIFLHSP